MRSENKLENPIFLDREVYHFRF